MRGNILTTAGVYGPALVLTHSLVVTCEVCMVCIRKGNTPVASSTLLWEFNGDVEHDLMIVWAHALGHLAMVPHMNK